MNTLLSNSTPPEGTRFADKIADVKAFSLLAAALLLAGCGASAGSRPARPKPAPPVVHVKPKPRIVTPHDRPVPILMYHVVGAAPPGAPFPDLYVAKAEFAAQLRWLRTHGYHAVTLGQVDEYWRRGVALPARPIVLSFDDGYREDFTNVRPLLRRYGWPAVLNLAVQNTIDGKLTLPQLRIMAGSGWEIDAHSLTHPDLTTIDPAELRRQVAGSRRWIQSRLGVPVDFFCYPAGRYDATVVRAVRAAGFLAATTTRDGVASPRDGLLTLDRIRVGSGFGAAGLAARLASVDRLRS
jgi:peptidoglycan/xylan/chitin deacetylase (PgdA/CDA1 family)